jgi:hypothetical protein
MPKAKLILLSFCPVSLVNMWYLSSSVFYSSNCFVWFGEYHIKSKLLTNTHLLLIIKVDTEIIIYNLNHGYCICYDILNYLCIAFWYKKDRHFISIKKAYKPMMS